MTDKEGDVEKAVDVSKEGESGGNGGHSTETTTETAPLNRHFSADGERPAQRRTIIYKITHVSAANSHIGFMQSLVAYLFGTITGIIALIVANAVQIAMIIMGAVYVRDCPNSPGLPIALMVCGAINVALSVVESVKRNMNGESDAIPKLNRIIIAIKIAAAFAFLSLCFLVYNSKEANYDDKDANNYCNYYLFIFAFWLLNVILIAVAFLLIIACCCCWWSRDNVSDNN